MPQASPSAVFLDRDDTLIACRSVTLDGDLGDPALVRPLPGAIDACRRLREAGRTLVVVSNQGGVARGRYAEEDVEAVNRAVQEAFGGVFALMLFCPYHPRGTISAYAREHPWRKPAPGMLHEAARRLGLDLASSWMVGDQPRDCEAGRAAGCRTILVGETIEDRSAIDHVASDLPAAADLILGARSAR